MSVMVKAVEGRFLRLEVGFSSRRLNRILGTETAAVEIDATGEVLVARVTLLPA